MANVKFTEKGQDYRLERLKSLRETRKDLADLVELKFSPEWAKLVKLVRRWSQFAKNEETIANRDHDSGEIDAYSFSRLVTKARQKSADFDFIADILEKTKTQLESVDAEISRLEVQYAEAKEVLS